MKNNQRRKQRNVKNFNKISDQLKIRDKFILLDAIETKLESFGNNFNFNF